MVNQSFSSTPRIHVASSLNSKRLQPNKPQPKPAYPETIHLRSVKSTNDYARVLAGSGAQHGTVVIADIQTRGKGRAGSKWISPAGGLWMSIILRPESRAKQLYLIPLLASLTITEMLKKYGVTGQIKWPNDVVVDGLKIAGILCESSVAQGRFQWIIIGIGINVNNPPPAVNSRYRATAMIRFKGEETDLSALTDSIRVSIMQRYGSLLEDGERVMLDEYNALHVLRNHKVRVVLRDHIVEGVARQVDSQGRLSVENSDGTIHKLRSEEVIHIEIM